MNFLKIGIEGLPSVDIDGTSLFIRTLGGSEITEVLDDCHALARATTSAELKGQAPNLLKLKLLTAMIGGAENATEIVGEVDHSDAYSVNYAYCVAVHLSAFQAARALVLEDGTDAFPTFEKRAAFAVATSRRDDLIQKIEAAKAKLAGDAIPNDLPAVVAE